MSIQHRTDWKEAHDGLIAEMIRLGHPAELGESIAKELGSPKAIRRMTSYLKAEKPKSVEIVVDEMIAIKSEIMMWKEKKAAEEANVSVNAIINSGLLDGRDR